MLDLRSLGFDYKSPIYNYIIKGGRQLRHYSRGTNTGVDHRIYKLSTEYGTRSVV